jgi:hypothetical protein
MIIVVQQITITGEQCIFQVKFLTSNMGRWFARKLMSFQFMAFTSQRS